MFCFHLTSVAVLFGVVCRTAYSHLTPAATSLSRILLMNASACKQLFSVY